MQISQHRALGDSNLKVKIDSAISTVAREREQNGTGPIGASQSTDFYENSHVFQFREVDTKYQ